MNKINLNIFCIFLLLLPEVCFAARLTATVDRNQVDLDDIINLRLRIDQTNVSPPDLAALKSDFHLLGSSQNARHSWHNGQGQSLTEWHIQLTPKRMGQLLIPPIKVAQQLSNPITIHVQAGATQQQRILKVTLIPQQQNVYVRAQLLLTVQLMTSESGLQNARLRELKLDNASVTKIGEEQYNRIIQGINIIFFERRYAIFPQSSGELRIPPQHFSATLPLPHQQLSGWFISRPGKPVQIKSKPLTIKVLPHPPSFKGSHWLPAQRVQVNEKWSSDPTQLKIGDSITRIIEISVTAQPGVQIPAITMNAVAQLKIYPDKPVLQTQIAQEHVIGQRIEKIALIPLTTNPVLLPEIRLPWWNTQTDQQEIVIIPAREIRAIATQSHPNPLSDTTADHLFVEPPLYSLPWPWMGATGALLLFWVATMLLWWRQKPFPKPQNKVSITTRSNEQKMWQQLQHHWQNGTLYEQRQAILAWVKAAEKNKPINSALSEYIETILNNYNQALFKDATAPPTITPEMRQKWLAHLKQLRRKKDAPAEAAGQQLLPPLYPTS